METTYNVLELSPLFAHMDEDERQEALRYYSAAVRSAKVQSVLEACPQAKSDPSAARAAIDFGISLAEPFRRHT